MNIFLGRFLCFNSVSIFKNLSFVVRLKFKYSENCFIIFHYALESFYVWIAHINATVDKCCKKF